MIVIKEKEKKYILEGAKNHPNPHSYAAWNINFHSSSGYKNGWFYMSREFVRFQSFIKKLKNLKKG